MDTWRLCWHCWTLVQTYTRRTCTEEQHYTGLWVLLYISVQNFFLLFVLSGHFFFARTNCRGFWLAIAFVICLPMAMENVWKRWFKTEQMLQYVTPAVELQCIWRRSVDTSVLSAHSSCRLECLINSKSMQQVRVAIACWNCTIITNILDTFCAKIFIQKLGCFKNQGDFSEHFEQNCVPKFSQKEGCASSSRCVLCSGNCDYFPFTRSVEKTNCWTTGNTLRYIAPATMVRNSLSNSRSDASLSLEDLIVFWQKIICVKR